jgi:hypothetical protein
MRFTKEDVIKDIKEEGYKHQFFFANFNDATKARVALADSDEVWCFGDCQDIVYYKIAKERGSDIWQMK